MDDLLVEHVLVAVEQVPRGRVVSYGDIAALVGTGPRQVGSIMRVWGGNVTWWRVVNAAGVLPAGMLERAREHWIEEGTPARPGWQGCRMRDARADLPALATAYERASAHLPAPGSARTTPDGARSNPSSRIR